jgi:hypothetical protein
MSESLAFDPDERRVEAMMDQSGIRAVSARARFEDAHIDEDRPSRNGGKAARRSRPTGRAAVEVSGTDVSIRLANQDALRTPPVPVEQRRATYQNGAAMARAALESPVTRAVKAYDAEIADADPDYRDTAERQAELALGAAFQKIKAQKK